MCHGCPSTVLAFDGIMRYLSRDVWKKEENTKARINKRTVQHTWANKLSRKLSKGEEFTSLTPRFLYFPNEEKCKCKQNTVYWQG